ncbi:MAG: ribbon-helix-helix protein, CopG family [Xanthomonadales bacterium]|nr:ribbon-helix-helix protein, CopG family [Xanthomonadales bacterium]
MSTEAFSVRTDSKKVRKLDKLAQQQDRSRNYLVNQAIDQYLDLHAWQEKRIKEGIKAADAGQFVSDIEMNEVFNQFKDA